MLKMQLITEQRVVVVKTYYKTSCYLKVKEAFRKKKFQRKTHQQLGQYGKNKNYEREGISLNFIKGRFRKRRRIVRTDETKRVVRLSVVNNARNVICM